MVYTNEWYKKNKPALDRARKKYLEKNKKIIKEHREIKKLLEKGIDK